MVNDKRYFQLIVLNCCQWASDLPTRLGVHSLALDKDIFQEAYTTGANY